MCRPTLRILTGLLLSLCAPIGFPQAISPAVVEQASKAVVFIKGATESGQVTGSGFLLTRDGKIATNLHVIRDMKSGGVQLSSGEIFDRFSILAFDERK